MKQIILIAGLLISMSAQAIWYEAKGQATIVNNDFEQAKSLATQDAVKQLLLYSGASVTSISKVSGGQLTLDQIEVVSKGSLHNLTVLDEGNHGQQYYIILQADVFPATSQCKASGYSKNMLLLPPFLKQQHQARVGQLQELSPAIEQRTYDIARQVSNQFNVKPPPKLPLNYYKPGEHNYKGIKDVADRYGAQYLLGLEIENISLDQVHKPKFINLSYPQRYFVVNARVYNAIDLEEIYNKRFSVNAPWEFDAREVVSPHSAEFWLSSYGETVNSTLQQVVTEVDALLACQPLQGSVVKVLGPDRWQINLGKANQLNRGMLLSLIHQNYHWGNWDIPRQEQIIADSMVRIEQVYQESAIVVAVDPSMTANIQLGDLVSKQ
ncbi:flagellar assembly protein T N-terminal domain-containing protein [Agarivorans sp. Alg241-V36]|uniref:flagellar assembly protein T N-terminal domain-containing protein n=1 Tax=Agarivorans sp. Alg241-V36 TaxID=2305992 RepID=UPI0013D3ACEC|nr:flagellar assembly protein T N-terminal domain-containing protein [Agarivorans sp. Alg241-V36]